MIENRVTLSLLFFAAKIGRKKFFYPINQILRASYLHFAIPFLRQQFQKIIPSAIVEIVPRHSVLSEAHFSAFESDLDFSLIVDTEISKEDAARIMISYDYLRRRLPFLGEIEIYERWEHLIKNQIADQFGKEIQYLTGFRKWVWQSRSLATATSAYHVQKIEAGMGKTKAKLGWQNDELIPKAKDGNVLLQLLLRGLGDFSSEAIQVPAAQFLAKLKKIHLGYLGWTLCESTDAKLQKDDSFILSGTLPQAFLVLALIPDAANFHSEIEAAIQKLREQAPIRTIYLAICVHEFLTTRSVIRTEKAGEHPNLKEWNRYLLKQALGNLDENSFGLATNLKKELNGGGELQNQ